MMSAAQEAQPEKAGQLVNAHFTQWERHGKDAELLLGDTGEVLGSFHPDHALVDGMRWELHADRKQGATATVGERAFLLQGGFRQELLTVVLPQRTLTIHNEINSNFVVLDEQGLKIAQFSGANRGVRKAILERDAEEGANAQLTREEVAFLSWCVTLLLEARLSGTSTAWLGALGTISVIAALAAIFL